MKKVSRSEPRKQIPYWITLIIWVVATCVGANVLTLIFQFGGFTPWRSLPKPPAEAIHIVDADGSKIWVEAQNGDLFTLTLYCGQSEKCREWETVKNAAEINPFQCVPLQRGSYCSALDEGAFSPNNPITGKVVECVGTDVCVPDPEFVSETYFALMSDGTVKYWGHGRGILSAAFFFVVSTIVLPILAVFIVSIVLMVHAKRKQSVG